MTTYESKLDVFANGKTLIRLAHQVRDRADARCDACGSTQPRILTGLRDPDSDRYFFVGDTCLKELMNRRVISRGYGRNSGPAAYDAEMRIRSAELKNVSLDNTEDGTSSEERSRVSMGSKSSAPFTAHLSPMIAVVETHDSYSAYVYVITDEGVALSSGFAEEPRFQEVWQLGADQGLVLERVSIECAEALDRSVDRAWHQACEGLTLEQPTALPWKKLPVLNAASSREASWAPMGINRQSVVVPNDLHSVESASAR